jgi:hypothetical protein
MILGDKEMSSSMPLSGARRRPVLLDGWALAGIGYTISWIAGLSLGAPSPGLRDSGSALLVELHGHQMVVVTQFLLTEGLPAVGVAVIALGLARFARRGGSGAAARTLRLAGLLAASISCAQFALGVLLASATAPATAQALWQAVARLDGAKMLALAVVGAAVAAAPFGRGMRVLGFCLAVTIAASGVAYALLLTGFAWLAYPAGLLLLGFVTTAGIALARAGGTAR